MVAFYLRISKAERKGRPGSSLHYQRKLLEQWLQQEPELSGEEVKVFSDDGYSGMREDRPEFEIMLAQIMIGRIQVLAVKDFSRLTRDHLLLSALREELFPALGTVFVSLGDAYDSRFQEAWGLGLAFRSLFYEYYCHDISRKVKSALAAKKQAGDYAVARVPFGYRRSEETGDWVLEENEAGQIRRMFAMALAGESYRAIGRQMGMDPARVWQILHNPAYTGRQVWHKSENRVGGTVRTEYMEREQWRYRRNCHPAVISEELFAKVTRQRQEHTGKKRKRHLFHGITKCMECGRALCMDRRKKGILCCNHCGKTEEKRIEIDALFALCREEWLRQYFRFRRCNHSQTAFFDMQSMLDSRPELFLQEMVSRVWVSRRQEVEILWNFRRGEEAGCVDQE